jgi:tetratricopeptide (TPR) repeat protein
MIEEVSFSGELDSASWRTLKTAVHSFHAALRRGEQPAIDGYLPVASPLRDTVLVELVHEELEFCLKGGTPVRVDEYLKRYPELASDHESVRALRSMEAALRARRPADSPVCGRHPPTPLCTRLGRFELREVVGQGSFGVVYKAWDTGLNRVVALKVARDRWPAAADHTRQLLREARSAARLRHAHIAGVYDVGQIDGLCYLVQEFVGGTTLEKELQRGPLAPRRAAGLAALVAKALDHAHAQGVIHRDLKPANILLDQEGAPFVADFGLAKNDPAESSSSGDDRLVGTPAYMAPEQARGDARRVDGRSDVYSLGVILYQMLTGELPFGGMARMVLYQAVHVEPRPPRTLNDRIPRDLETICLKAMAKESHRRYATATGLAEDLQRFLNGEPIHARRTGALARGVIRLRRRPAVAALLGATLLITVAGFLGVTWQWLRAERYRRSAEISLAEASSNLEEAQRQRHAVSSNLEQANRAINGLVMRLGEVQGSVAFDAFQTRRVLTEQLVDDGWAFLGQLRSHPLFHLDSARCSLSLAGLTSQSHDAERAIAGWCQALAHCQQLVRVQPNNVDAMEMLATCRFNLAAWQDRGGRLRDAWNQYIGSIGPCRFTRELLLRRLRENPRDGTILPRLAGCEWELVASYSKAGRLSDALELMRDAQDLAEARLRENAHDAQARAWLLGILNTISPLYEQLEQPKLALSLAQRAHYVAEELVSTNPSSFEARSALAETCVWLSQFMESRGRLSEALGYSQRALDVRSLIAPERQRSSWSQIASSFALMVHGRQSRLAGDAARAVSCLQTSLQIGDRLIRDHPRDPSLRDHRAQVISELVRACGEPAVTRRLHTAALGVSQSQGESVCKVAPQHASQTIPRRDHVGRSEVQSERDRLKEAEAASRSSVLNWEALARDRTSDRSVLLGLIEQRYRLSWTLDALEKPEEALRSYWETVAIDERALQAHPGDAAFLRNLRTCLHQIGTILNETGRPAEALGPYRRAIEISEVLARHNPEEDLHDLMDCAGTWRRIGEALERLGRLQEAADAYRNHLVRYRRAVSQEPAVDRYRAQLRDRLQDITRVFLMLGRWTEALEAGSERRALYAQDPEVALSVAFQLASALLPLWRGDSIFTSFLNQERRHCAVEGIATATHAARLIVRCPVPVPAVP